MDPPYSTYLWLAWIILTSVYLTNAIQFKNAATKTQVSCKYAGIFATALLAFYFFVGHAHTPIATSEQHTSKEYRTTEMISGLKFIKVKGLKYTQQAIDEAIQQGKGVFLDVFADWCTYCKQMDNTTFTDPGVQAELKKMVMIKIDITDDDVFNQALREYFQLRTPPPVYIFMDKTGQEIPGTRVYGYKNAEQFLERLNRVNSI
jgi:thiol:disulfide interchange protein DsbD